MIYLLDHHKERQEKTFKINEYISNYKEIVKCIYSKQDIKTDTTPLTLSDFPNATCFLLHLSFEEDKVAEDVEAIAKKHKLPITVFTNKSNLQIGFNDSKIKLTVSATKFYTKLKAFLDYYEIKKEIDLSMLFYDYKVRDELISLINSFKNLLSLHGDNDKIELPYPSNEKELERIFVLLEKKDKFESFWEQIDNSEITKYNFFREIQ